MNRTSIFLSISVLLTTGSALAQSQCERPAAVDIPDGSAATLDQMLEAQSGVRDYLAAMEAYLDCMDDVIESATEDTAPETRNTWVTNYNAAVDEMEATATRFNEERVAYQQANPSD
jgi:hypothetical protein